MVLKNILWIVGFILLSQLAGAIGSLFTYSAIPTWYAGLEKPFFNPPNWVFGPVWTVLYSLMGIAAFLVFQKGWLCRKPQAKTKKAARSALSLFFIQLVVNSLWSIIFFGMQSPLFAFLEICLLWVIIFVMIKRFVKLSKLAAYLLVPYLLWISFALILNLAIVILNH